MNLEEIEAKADELLADVLSEDHASRAEHAARKLRCLELTARIKSTVAFRKEREEDAQKNEARRERETVAMEVAADAAARATAPRVGLCYDRAQTALAYSPPITCTLPAGHAGGHSDGTTSWTHGDAEPTKPVADRLHELVSYLQQQAEECRGEADRGRDIIGQEAHKQPGDYMAPVYSEAATKLSEILNEGGI